MDAVTAASLASFLALVVAWMFLPARAPEARIEESLEALQRGTAEA